MKHLLLILRIVVAIILLQTLFYKFSAHPDSVYIFEQTGLGTTGRIGVGILELLASILLLLPKTIWQGALLSTMLMFGALFSHLTSLGIEVHNDGGKLFYMALVTWVLSIAILWHERKNIPFIN